MHRAGKKFFKRFLESKSGTPQFRFFKFSHFLSENCNFEVVFPVSLTKSAKFDRISNFIKVCVVNAAAGFLTYCLHYHRYATPRSPLQNI